MYVCVRAILFFVCMHFHSFSFFPDMPVDFIRVVWHYRVHKVGIHNDGLADTFTACCARAGFQLSDYHTSLLRAEDDRLKKRNTRHAEETIRHQGDCFLHYKEGLFLFYPVRVCVSIMYIYLPIFRARSPYVNGGEEV
jgi:hypothetical protein